MNIIDILHKTVSQDSLTETEAYFFMLSAMKGEVSEIILSSWLTALKIKSPTKEELLGCVKAMRESAVKTTSNFDFDFIDTCGTGGDGKNSINLSTLSALTLSSLGIKVAKHGNRSVSSLSGSSDILSHIGININKAPKEVEQDLLNKGFAFLFAPAWHPSMKFAVNVRKNLGFRTVFNVLGPLSNPFYPNYQMIGVYDQDLMDNVLYVFVKLGIKSVIVCHSLDGLDEFSIFHPTKYLIYKGGKTEKRQFDPKSLQIKQELKENELYCHTKEDVINITESILSGTVITGTYAVALNAGVGLYLIGRVDSIEEGYKIALTQLESGKVKEYVELLKN
ncbi:MAG: anthranilate phosphoribosyltransferase [Leptospiraceae bacterium]|nr:anthranilate phosphoribosyltransferase [Leptospiraceae bacterium]MCP5495169.1 anthranilate phosphoribosyltransferase [Leptospiraceae bacterium]